MDVMGNSLDLFRMSMMLLIIALVIWAGFNLVYLIYSMAVPSSFECVYDGVKGSWTEEHTGISNMFRMVEIVDGELKDKVCVKVEMHEGD